MKSLIYRPVVIISLVLGLLVISELLALGGLTWKNLKRIDTIKQDIKQSHELEQLLFGLLAGKKPPQSLPAAQNLSSATIADQSAALKKVRNLLDNPSALNNRTEALQILSKALPLQIRKEEQLLDNIYNDSQLELKLAILIPSGVVLLLLLVGQFFFNRHVASPIQSLDKLLSNLIEGKRRPIEDVRRDSILYPLFQNYNRLVTRLNELEKEHKHYTESLRKEVYNATHALLEQSHSLARAERLAAVGELAASAAHELRNPLAGIQVALENMQNDCSDADLSERMHIVNSEIKRLTDRLNDLLNYSRQSPEKSQQFDLYPAIEELFTLLNYQVADNIQLKFLVDKNLTVFLPPNELRQALLNLLLNAIQSIADQGGTIQLIAQQQHKQIVFTLVDSGPGFPETLLQQGIRPFASYKKQGTGLGLPMVQRFAKNHGGQLILSNTEQHHACVTLSLPNPS